MSRGISCLVRGTIFVACLFVSTKPSLAGNCVLYVRGETGVALYGAAGGWWDEAAGRYQRGQAPAVGAILVFKRTGHMRSGHVALVTNVVSAQEILVDHANWYHGAVTRGMPVIDVSPNHDWTSVAVKELRSGKFGRDNPTFGFVYPVTGPHDTLAQAGLVHFAVATEYPDSGDPASGLRHRYLHRVHARWTAHTRGGQTSSSGN
jgi:surface antigen